MKAEIQEIDLHKITRDDAKQIRAELNKLTNGGLVFHADKYPKLVELDKILNGCFDTMANGIHYVSTRE